MLRRARWNADRSSVQGCRMIDITVPGDKSISHRSLMFAALADGESVIRGILDSDDVRSTARCLGAFGIAVPELSNEIRIQGRGLRGFTTPTETLDCRSEEGR